MGTPRTIGADLARALSRAKGSLRLHQAFDLSIEALFVSIRRDDEAAAVLRQEARTGST